MISQIPVKIILISQAYQKLFLTIQNTRKYKQNCSYQLNIPKSILINPEYKKNQQIPYHTKNIKKNSLSVLKITKYQQYP
jgi:hypothetical protein